MSEPGTTYIDVGGRRLEVADLPGDEPALVFLHEGLGSVGLWRGVPEEIGRATGRRTVAFSRFGYGDSDPPRAPRTAAFFEEEALEVLPALLAQLAIAEPVLVGHSDGASIALIHAARHPVRALAVLAPHVFVEEMGLVAIRAVRDTYAGELRPRMARHHRDPDAAFGGWADVWLDPGFTTWSIEAYLPAITAPVLVIQGRDDQYGTLAQVDAIERGVSGPVRRLVVAGGHSPHLEQREAVVPALVELALGRPVPGRR